MYNKINNTNEVTLVVPTKNRNTYLSRLIKYYKYKSFNGTIIILDASDGENLKKNKDLLSKKFSFNIKHVIEDKRPMQSVCKNLHLIKTKFVTVCNDDDIIVYEGLHKSSEILELDNNYSSCWGYGIKVETKLDDPFEMITSVKRLNHNFNYNDKNSFLYQIANSLGYDVIFALHRKKNFKKIINFAIQFDCEVFQSIAMNFLTTLISEFKLINNLYLIRQNHDSRDMTSLRSDPKIWLTEKSFPEELSKFMELFSIEINKMEDISVDESNEIIKNAFFVFLKNKIEKKITVKNFHTKERQSYLSRIFNSNNKTDDFSINLFYSLR